MDDDQQQQGQHLLRAVINHLVTNQTSLQIATHRLLLVALGRLSLDDDISTLLVRRKDLGVEFELDALLGENLLELLAFGTVSLSIVF